MPVFDKDELLDRVGGDWDFLAETVDMLKTDGLALLDQIRAALAAGDAAALGRHGHAIKGMISNFCAPAAHASAFEVEKIGKSGDLGAALPAVDALAASLDQLIAALNELLSVRA
jgi:two-component system, sensor histidine kinase and response regulator